MLTSAQRAQVERIHLAYKFFCAAEPRFFPSRLNEQALFRALFRSHTPEEAENPAAWHALFKGCESRLSTAPRIYRAFRFVAKTFPALMRWSDLQNRPTFAAPRH